VSVIKDWRKATEELSKEFFNKYFKDGDYKTDTRWVCDRVGDVFCIGDYFFNVDWMLEALELKASAKKMFAYYDYELDCLMDEKPVRINFRNYVKYGFVGLTKNN